MDVFTLFTWMCSLCLHGCVHFVYMDVFTLLGWRFLSVCWIISLSTTFSRVLISNCCCVNFAETGYFTKLYYQNIFDLIIWNCVYLSTRSNLHFIWFYKGLVELCPFISIHDKHKSPFYCSFISIKEWKSCICINIMACTLQNIICIVKCSYNLPNIFRPPEKKISKVILKLAEDKVNSRLSENPRMY